MKWLALLALCASPAFGQVTLSCTPPTTNTDGSTIAAAQLPLTFKFYEGTTLGTYPNALTAALPTCGAVIAGLASGVHYFVATAIDKLGNESAASAPASKTVLASGPSPPTTLTVQTDRTAWTILQSRDRIAMIAVGTIAAGTACDPTQQVLGKFVVPVSSVKFPGTVRPEVVFASCG